MSPAPIDLQSIVRRLVALADAALERAGSVPESSYEDGPDASRLIAAGRECLEAAARLLPEPSAPVLTAEDLEDLEDDDDDDDG
jgi:hypothetical protein